ncbi:Transmembrane protein 53-A [Porphyridium purpureum]|uniref:Transmembrane protein 53-A n=1 Tax=Porphyridium purpureum TaxID=35688 RepID=A0A5J4YJF4_PORPP|nr:Transmembrane protein 53-A [Porphyridium purpureum]|eukprot:POR5064..scf289_17
MNVAPLRRPITLLLGWLGCQPRHLEKYVSLHQSIARGTDAERPGRDVRGRNIILAFTPSPLGLLCPLSRARQTEAEQIRARMRQLMHSERDNEHDAGVVVHAFSNNGFFFLCELLRDRCFARQLEQFGGSDGLRLILDSAPGPISPAAVIESAVALGLCARQTADRPLVLRAVTSYLALSGMARRERSLRLVFERRWTGPRDLNRPRLRVLCLHGRNDRVVPLSEVDAWLRRQQARAGNSARLTFTRVDDFEGPHCALLKDEPDKYRDAVELFLRG